MTRYPDTPRKFLNTAKVAEMMGTTEAAIRLLVFRRRIPHLKVEGRVLFDELEILRWLERHRRTSLEDIEGA